MFLLRGLMVTQLLFAIGVPLFGGARAPRSAPVRPRIGIDPVADFVIPIIYDGSGYRSSLFVTNRDQKPVHVGIFFYAADGSAVDLPIAGLGRTGAVLADLDVNQSLSFQTTGESTGFIDAYALVLTFTGPPNDPMSRIAADLISGMAMFAKTVDGVLVEAPAPLSSGFETACALPFDERIGNASAVVLLNPDPSNQVDVNLTFRDENGGLLKRALWTVAPGAKAVIPLAATFPELANKSGRVYISAEGDYLTVIGLHSNSTGAFTTVFPFSIDERLLP